MSVHSKLVRAAALCSLCLLIGWSTTTYTQAPSLFSNVKGAIGVAIPPGLNVAHQAYTKVETKPEDLGINGRPRLTPQRPQDERAPDPKDDGSHLSEARIEQYVTSVLDLDDAEFWRMECPDQGNPGPRYEVLRRLAQESSGIKYFFTLDLYNVIDVLPRLMGSIVQAIKILGPNKCAISIVEGRSQDGTYMVLHKLREELQKHNVRYWLQQSDIDPHEHGKDRIEGLSKLRNMALDPLRDHREEFDASPLAFFVNDVAVCVDDLLELLYQHLIQNATQTCAMDWVDGGNLFYDSWVSRSMSGNTFFEIPQDMSFAFSRNLFWDEPIAKDKYHRNQPFQVFSCWGGMTVLDSRPFMNGDISFRRNHDGECYGGEPQTLASDFVKLGINKVATVPYVAVVYDNHAGAQAKGVHKHVSKHVDTKKEILRFQDDIESERIRWKKPPPRYRCMPSFVDHWWVDSVFDPAANERIS